MSMHASNASYMRRHHEYSLNVVNLPMAAPEPSRDALTPALSRRERGRHLKKERGQGSLVDDEDGK